MDVTLTKVGDLDNARVEKTILRSTVPEVKNGILFKIALPPAKLLLPAFPEAALLAHVTILAVKLALPTGSRGFHTDLLIPLVVISQILDAVYKGEAEQLAGAIRLVDTLTERINRDLAEHPDCQIGLFRLIRHLALLAPLLVLA